MTGQGLLDRMELINAELQLQTGEEDVTRGLLALNVAQDYFESLAAARAKLFWGTSTGTVTTSSSTETTSFPTGVLRIDRLQLLGSDNLPKWDLKPLQRTGGHRSTMMWPFNLLSSSGSGEPRGYWTTGTSIYWLPLPSGTSTVRWTGFKSADDITVGGTFAYPDIAALPLAAMAVQIMKAGVDDDANAAQALASATFGSVLQTLEMTDRSEPKGFHYTQVHNT